MPNRQDYPFTTYGLCTASIAEDQETKAYAKKIGGIDESPLEDQKDLLKMTAVLFSVGANKNDDVFLPKEMIEARHTGAHKPVNIEHDPGDIIGNIIRTYIADKDGNRVPDNEKPKDKQFDIIAESVLYKFMFPSLILDIEDRASANKLFVSVEVWFSDYDFAVGNKIVKRNAKSSSIFDPKLKINGGTGVHNGQKVRRVLRNFLIGGLGIVKNPANPESVIKSVGKSDLEDVSFLEEEIYDFEDIPEYVDLEVNMDNNVVEEMAAVASVAKAANEAENKETETKEPVEKTEAGLKDSPFLDSIMKKLENLERANRETKQKLDDAEFKAEAARRENVLRQAGFEDETIINEFLTKGPCFNMTKAQFDDYVSFVGRALESLTKNKKEPVVASEVVEEATAPTADEEVENVVESLEQTDVSGEEVVADTVDEVNAETDNDSEVVDEDLEIEIDKVDPEFSTTTEVSDPDSDIETRFQSIIDKLLGK